MDSADLKGIAWVGNVYQKFEAMCLEVEEAMYQETAKYVENQVQTMGANMKRFYSDVMQDLHPPLSVDHEKVAAADVVPNPCSDAVLKKPKENIKEHAKKCIQFKGFSEKNSSPPPLERSPLSNEVPNDHFWPFSIGEEGKVVHGEKICNSSMDADDSSTETATSGPILPAESSVRKGEEANETIGDCRLVYQVATHSSGDMQHDQSTNEEVYMNHTGDSNVDTIGNDETQDLRMGTRGEIPTSNLEETVVFVEEDVYSESSNRKKSKSYKKKIRQAFSLKLKSGRKQEYKQLAAEHVNNITRTNLESAETEMPTLAMNSQLKNSQTDDFLESEWELL